MCSMATKNPNQAFKDREYTGIGSQRMRSEQYLTIRTLMHREAIGWKLVAARVFYCHKPLFGITFKEAAKVITFLQGYNNE